MIEKGKNKILKLNDNSTDESLNTLPNKLFKKAEELTWRHIREENYIGDKVDDAKNANKLYLKAIKLNPSFQNALNGYAQNLRLIIKDYESAIDVYTKLIDINPNYESAYIRRGYCKSQLNDYQGHLDDFNKSISINNGKMDVDDYVSRSIIKQKLKDYKGVRNDLLEAIKLGRVNAYTYERLGKAYIELNDYHNSFRAFEKAIEIELTKIDKSSKNAPFPLLYRVYDVYITTLFKNDNHKKASEHLEKMKFHFPEKPRTIELINLLNLYN